MNVACCAEVSVEHHGVEWYKVHGVGPGVSFCSMVGTWRAQDMVALNFRGLSNSAKTTKFILLENF